MSLMNTFWNILDWFLPPIRLSDDLDDPEAQSVFSGTLSTISRSRSPSAPPTRLRIQSSTSTGSAREWEAQREREQREREREKERERDRQRIATLEREKAALAQRVSQLEHDLRNANQSLAALKSLSSSSTTLSPTSLPPPPSPPLDSSSLRTAYEALRQSQALTQKILRERTEEIASLRSFLTKTDDWSGAQLLQALRDLNTEIVQLAASVADEFAPTLDRRVDYIRNSDRDLVQRALGSQMVDLLLSRNHSQDPTLVQFAVQAWEVACVGRIMDTFCFGISPEVDLILGQVFERMHRLEPQATTSRWRALTHAHMRSLFPANNVPLTPVTPSTTPPPATTPLQLHNEHNLRGLLAILVLSGCTDANGIHREPLRARYGAALNRLSERASTIARAIREGVMSASFEIVVVPPASNKPPPEPSSRSRDRNGLYVTIAGESKWFDEESMDNVFAGLGGEAERGRVLCTVEFGLACVRKIDGTVHMAPTSPTSPTSPQSSLSRATSRKGGYVTSSGGSIARSNSIDSSVYYPAEGMLTRSLLMKPKVLLDSVTDLL